MTTIQACIDSLSTIPAAAANDTGVQDAVIRLRQAVALALSSREPTDEAPSYVLKARKDMSSWIERRVWIDTYED